MCCHLCTYITRVTHVLHPPHTICTCMHHTCNTCTRTCAYMHTTSTHVSHKCDPCITPAWTHVCTLHAHTHITHSVTHILYLCTYTLHTQTRITHGCDVCIHMHMGPKGQGMAVPGSQAPRAGGALPTPPPVHDKEEAHGREAGPTGEVLCRTLPPCPFIPAVPPTAVRCGGNSSRTRQQ